MWVSGSGKKKVENKNQGEEVLTEPLMAQIRKEMLREIVCYSQGEGTLALIARALLSGDKAKALQLYHSPPDLFSEVAQEMAWTWLSQSGVGLK